MNCARSANVFFESKSRRDIALLQFRNQWDRKSWTATNSMHSIRFRAFVFKNRFRLGGSLRCKYQNNFSSWSGTRPWVRVPTQSKEIKKWAFLHEQEEPVAWSSREPLHLDIWCWVRLNFDDTWIIWGKKNDYLLRLNKILPFLLVIKWTVR